MSASACQRKHEEERPCCGRHFIFIPFIDFCYLVADIDIVCGRYGACCGRYDLWRVMLKTAGEAGDVKTGWVRLSTSAPLRLITSGEAGERRANVIAAGNEARRARRQTDRRPPRRAT